MPVFRYFAVDAAGASIEGTLEDISAERVRALLRERGCQVNGVIEVTPRPSVWPARPLSWEDLNLLNEQLLAIARSGLPLAPSLHAVAAELRRPRLRSALESLRARIERGESVEQAFSGEARRFPSVYMSLIRAGERSGNLPEVLEHLLTHSRRMVSMKSKLQETLAYPIVVLTACVIVLGFVLFEMTPMFADTYAAFGISPPWITRVAMKTADVLPDSLGMTLVWTFFAAVAGVTFYCIARQSAGRRRFFDRAKLHLPVFGGVFRASALARFSRTLGLLLAHRVPAPESIALAGAAAGNSLFEDGATEATQGIAEGQSLAQALRAPGLFGERFCWMVETAEARGDVENALAILAEGYERDVARRDAALSLLLGPALTLLIGAVVLVLMIAIYYPVLGFVYYAF